MLQKAVNSTEYKPLNPKATANLQFASFYSCNFKKLQFIFSGIKIRLRDKGCHITVRIKIYTYIIEETHTKISVLRCLLKKCE